MWPLRPQERARRAAVDRAARGILPPSRRPPGRGRPHRQSVRKPRPAVPPRPPGRVVDDDGDLLPVALKADASPRVSILAERDAAPVESKLGALGASATLSQFGAWRFFDDVRVPARAFRLLSRAGWRVVGEPGMPPSVADGDLGTEWPARRLADSEAAPLVLDMGVTHAVARLVLWPTALTDVLVPLEVAGSVDATTWERLGVTPTHVAEPAFSVEARPLFRPRNGWLELVISPRPVRYLRVRPVEAGSIGVGMVGELFVYEAADQLPSPGRRPADALLERLRARGVTRFLADPVHLGARRPRDAGRNRDHAGQRSPEQPRACAADPPLRPRSACGRPTRSWCPRRTRRSSASGSGPWHSA